MSRPRVVIVGAGFAGLTLARSLRGARLEVTLVDRENYHLFTPLLYQVASSLLEPAEISHSVRSLVRPLHGVDFRQATVTGFDLDGRRVLTDHGEIGYDRLVVAAGSETNWFGNAGVEGASMGLKRLPDAMAIRNWVLSRFEAARWELDPRARLRLLTFVVAGGGPTGVEMAGALAELVRLVLRRDFPEIEVRAARVVLVEGSASLLGSFDPRLREAARRSLRDKGVEVRLDALVRGVEGGTVQLSDTTSVEADTLVWTAGVRGSALGAALGAELSRSGRVPVDGRLAVPGRPEVHVVGDLALVTQDGAELPMLIPVAMQEAKYVARVIIEATGGRPAGDFEYSDPGIMATIGRNSAVAQLGRVRLAGFPGWLMWLAVHLVNVVTFRSRLVVLVNWAWDYLFYDRPVRIIVRADPPRTPGPG